MIVVASHSVAGGKGFGTPSILDYVPLRKFNPADPRHLELAALSRRLHAGPADARAEDEIDRLAALALRGCGVSPQRKSGEDAASTHGGSCR